jgi:hypothetical protein
MRNKEFMTQYSHVQFSEGPIEDKVMLVLTKNGWVPAHTVEPRKYSIEPMF